ncbi:Nif3-like dinuclear metal center hexameric protein [Candidatus Gottesmanbacteria bacterium]|nr:Nif3-like dinuclear metal center hexameric protein [Candidatus Gottesmanbacteria bacterium]
MIKLFALEKFLDDYLYFDRKLDIAKIDPYMANGLMVRGREEIKKIGFGVSASLDLFEKAKETNCDAVIVHHAFNLPPYNRYDKIFQSRIGFLLKNEISLFGYHFLLDAHPEVGNNVQILKVLGAKPVKQFFHHGNPWGWIGELVIDEDLTKIENKLKPFLSKRSINYHFGPQKVKRIVAISGKGAPIASAMQDLINDNIDLYITGEVHEWNRELFREAKINFIAGGHYATEVFGVKALMRKVKEKFPELGTEWLEVYNDV